MSAVDMEECTGLKTYDYFTQSEGLLAVVLILAALVIWIIGKHTAHHICDFKLLLAFFVLSRLAPCHKIVVFRHMLLQRF